MVAEPSRHLKKHTRGHNDPSTVRRKKMAKYRKKPVVIEAFLLNERGLVGEDWFWDGSGSLRKENNMGKPRMIGTNKPYVPNNKRKHLGKRGAKWTKSVKS